MEERTVVWALCGSFCTFEKVLPLIGRMAAGGTKILPLMSFNAAGLDTRFGGAADWKMRLYAAAGSQPIETLQGAGPWGPKTWRGAMIIAPCTGATLAKLAHGISDTPVTLGAKEHAAGGKARDPGGEHQRRPGREL